MLDFEKDLGDFEIPENADCIVTKAGNVVDIVYSALVGDPCIKKISKEEYVNLKTGEIKNFNHQEKRVDDYSGLLNSFSKLRLMINSNVSTNEDTLFLTLTYALKRDEAGNIIPMKDSSKLHRDFGAYNTRFYRYLDSNKMQRPRWVSCVEPQGNGSWHLHILYFWDKGRRPFIHFSILKSFWKQGMIKPERVEDNDDVGRYLCAYLCDFKKEDSHTIEKRKRLVLYPAGMRVWRCSRDCYRPSRYWDTFEGIKKDLKGATLRSKTATRLVISNKSLDNKGDGVSDDCFAKNRVAQENIIVHYQYNLKATKKYLPVFTTHDYAALEEAKKYDGEVPDYLKPRLIGEYKRKNEEKFRVKSGMSYLEFNNYKKANPDF